MTVQELHYSFKIKSDKLDSVKTRNLLPAEIDWILNEAIQAFVDNKYNDFETTQDLIDQLSSLTIKCPTTIQPAVNLNNVTSGVYELRLNTLLYPYLHLIRLNVKGSKTGCADRIIRGNQVQHDDLDKVLISPFEGPNFTWGLVPYVFGKENTNTTNQSVYLYTNNQFNITEAYPEYIKRPVNVFFGGYNSLNGQYTNISTPVTCDLPEAFHRRIVDIAVMETSRILNKPDFQLAFQKTINQ